MTAVAWRLRPGLRRSLLTLHIVAGVALLGDVAVILAIGVRATTTDDPQLAAAAWELLSVLPFLFGIPLSFISLLTGVALGLGSKWGVLRHAWVRTKLVLNVSVIIVGALLIGPALTALADGREASEGVVLAGAAWDVAALTFATSLGVFKPRRRG
jgi:hypothetical protein